MLQTVEGAVVHRVVLATAGLALLACIPLRAQLLPHRCSAGERQVGSRSAAGRPEPAMLRYGPEEAPPSGPWMPGDGGRLSRDPTVHGGTRRAEETYRESPDATWPTGSPEHERVPARVCSASNPLFMMNPHFVVATEYYDFNGESGGPSHYSYGKDGRLVEKVFERSDGLRTVTTFGYDDSGRLISSHRTYADGRTADFVYTYDDARRLSAKTFRRSDGAEGFERYAYDGVGRLAAAIYRNMDFWLNGTIVFAYDDRGHLTGGRFNGEDGFDADLEITTDAHGNVLRVHWVFSFGKTQTYTLGYRPV